jgi:2-polyprenyl-6-methoxyphenol hydroxylase-like FAD-dependent oxidoreductase
MDSDVLIIGAGPTGPVLALWLTKLGVKVRIIQGCRSRTYGGCHQMPRRR